MKIIIYISITIFLNLKDFHSQDWSTINKVTFNGFQNPNLTESIDKAEVLDIQQISKYIKTAKKCNSYFPKGASVYLTIEFEIDDKVVLQFIAGGYDIFHIIKSDNNYTDDWYKLDQIFISEWNDIIISKIK